jgi:GWxTD domain-containing protein
LKAGTVKDQKRKDKLLEPKYRQWLDIVEYIISPTERDIFFRLSNNFDRDTFIKIFWKLRDPTKGTVQNEFREEHLKRIRYANRFFKYGSTVSGWRTDRGRIYIILGPPIERREVYKNNLHPIEIWEYRGDAAKGFPTLFRIVFYRPGGFGNFKLYIPVEDGPASLLRTHIGEIDSRDYQKIYEQIREIDISVADVCLTLIPGERTFNYSPSLRGPVLMSQISNFPSKSINVSYAKNFLKYKGIVTVRETIDYVNMSGEMLIARDPQLNLHRVHLALRPERISLDYSKEKDQYYFNWDLMVLLKKGDTEILKYNKEFSFYYSKEELDKISHGIVLTDTFPIIGGHFDLMVVLQNSVTSEISFYERKIRIINEKNKPKILGPLISYRITKDSFEGYIPFLLYGNNINIDPQNIFGLDDRLVSFFFIERNGYSQRLKAELSIEMMDKENTLPRKFLFKLSDNKEIEYITKDMGKWVYGNYLVKVRLLNDSNEEISSSEKLVQVSAKRTIPHPPQARKMFKAGHRYLFYYLAAIQFQNIKKSELAEMYYHKAFKHNPRSVEVLERYSSHLLKQKKYDQLLDLIIHFGDKDRERFLYHSFRGKILYHKKKYKGAIESLVKATKIYDSDLSVLNTLGFAYIRIGNNKEAMTVLNASLKINKQQKDISAILKQLENNTSSTPKKLENE